MSEKTDVVEVVAASVRAESDAILSEYGPGRCCAVLASERLARAALSSIPVTEEMVEAGAAVFPQWGDRRPHGDFVRAIVQAALKAAVEG